MMRGMLKLPKTLARRFLSYLTSPRTALLFGEPFFWLLGIQRKRQEIDLSQIKRVLVVRLDEIGDVVMTTPFLRELRRNLPNAWITLVVKPTVYNLVELCPYVNEVLVYDWRVSRYLSPLQYCWRILQFVHRLWHHHFEVAIVPRWDTDYYCATLIAYFSGATWRVGYSENVTAQKKHLNCAFDRLLTHPLQDSTLKHEVEHNLDVIRFIGGEVKNDQLELWLGEEDKMFAEKLLRDYRVKPDDLLVGLAPGAGASKRLWPIDRFAELGSWLQNTYEARLLIVGGLGEELMGEKLEQAIGASVINTVGHVTLRQTVALLKHCRLFVGNDAGPMHMAAAVGVPVVEISCHPKSGSPYCANSPLRFRPWRIRCIVLQPETPRPPCTEECVAKYPHCILNITVEQVKQAVVKLLRQIQTSVKQYERYK